MASLKSTVAFVNLPGLSLPFRPPGYAGLWENKAAAEPS